MMHQTDDTPWELFEKSGQIEDYLLYRAGQKTDDMHGEKPD